MRRRLRGGRARRRAGGARHYRNAGLCRGLARELVRSIQDARKAAGLAIADRIAVTLAQADAELAAVVATWAGYLRAETLAETLTLEAPQRARISARSTSTATHLR
ncbi:MAG: DUF5915 domain-containing protein [Kouleothrix sp.]